MTTHRDHPEYANEFDVNAPVSHVTQAAIDRARALRAAAMPTTPTTTNRKDTTMTTTHHNLPQDIAANTWLWPDHNIGKRESRELREEHNITVNALAGARAQLAQLTQSVAGLIAQHIAITARFRMSSNGYSFGRLDLPRWKERGAKSVRFKWFDDERDDILYQSLAYLKKHNITPHSFSDLGDQYVWLVSFDQVDNVIALFVK